MKRLVKLFAFFTVFHSALLNEAYYSAIYGYLCILDSFTQTIRDSGLSSYCALLCLSEPNCQAFTTADGPCQLFVFNKCSKSVRDCNCTRRGQVFVKQQPGLQLGALCPPGYGDSLCGVKYKVSDQTGTWSQQLSRCQSESGRMVIFSDVTSAAELSRMESLYSKYSKSFWLGGFQQPGSVEPYGGWSWVECNAALDTTFWSSGEPSNSPENAVFKSATAGLSDNMDTATVFYGLCECLSPFE